MTSSLLFIDADPDVVACVRKVVHDQGDRWDATFAVGAEQGLAELGQRPYDVVVADIQMPGVEGATLLARVQEHQPLAVRIILSGNADPHAALKAIPLAHLFLAKPCAPEIALSVLERACRVQAMLADEHLRRAATAPSALPSVPSIYRKLTAAAARPTTTARDIGVILAGDPAMCAKVLQVVNSAFFGLGREIVDVHEAVQYLGIATVKALSLSAGAFEQLAATRSAADHAALARFRDHSVLTGTLASRLVGDRRHADEAFMAGILHDIGKLVLGAFEREAFDAAVVHARAEGLPLYQAEASLRGTTHAEVGAYLLALWGLPFTVVEAVGRHHAEPCFDEPLDVQAAVQGANLLAAEALAHAEADAGRARPSPLTDLVEPDRLVRWRCMLLEEAIPMQETA